MAEFATAVAYRDLHTRSMSGSVDRQHIGFVHAVRWPDAQGRVWESLVTLCDQSTRNMDLAEQANAAVWPQPGYEHMACPLCTAAVERGA